MSYFGRGSRRRSTVKVVSERMLDAFVESELTSELYSRWESFAYDALPQLTRLSKSFKTLFARRLIPLKTINIRLPCPKMCVFEEDDLLTRCSNSAWTQCGGLYFFE